MNFGEKLKKLRTDNQLTQDQLAEKIFVTRTAVSKWETNNGYPSIDNLKALSNLFGISIDELMSDEDIKNKKLLEDKNAKKAYLVAVVFLAVAVLFILLAYFLKLPYLNIVSSISVGLYVVFAFLSKPKYKRAQSRKTLAPYLISRLIIVIIVSGVIIFSVLMTI